MLALLYRADRPVSCRRRVYTGFDGLDEHAGHDGKVDVKLVSSWMTVGRRRPVFPADCPRAWRLLCEACWVLPPSPPEPASQESRLDLIARHKLAMDARPTLSQPELFTPHTTVTPGSRDLRMKFQVTFTASNLMSLKTDKYMSSASNLISLKTDKYMFTHVHMYATTIH